MAWQIVTEVLHHAPPGLGPAERLVLLVVAHQVHQRDVDARRYSCGLDELARLTGLAPNSVSAALTRLAGKGYDLRVPRGVDDHGRPVYAHRGRVSTFRIPAFPPPPGCSCAACTASGKAPRSSALPDSKGPTMVRERPHDREERPDDREEKGPRSSAPTGVQGSTGGQGAPAPSRCLRHAGLPDTDPGPPCRACGEARIAAEHRDAPTPTPIPPPPDPPRRLPPSNSPACRECGAPAGAQPHERMTERDGRPARCSCHPFERALRTAGRAS